jgi:hypothetical protein
VTSFTYEVRIQNRFVKFIGDEVGDDLKSGVGSGGTTADVALPMIKKIPEN